MFSQELQALRLRLAEVEKMRRHLIESISALERAQAHFQRSDGAEPFSKTESYDEDQPTQRGAIRTAIGVMPGEFSSRDVWQYLRDFQPAVHANLKPEVLSNVLYKFAREGLIKQVRQGTRGRPSAFVRVDGQAIAKVDEPNSVATDGETTH